MSNRAHQSTQWQLRVLAGCSEGISLTIDRGLSIGRAPSSDLHLGSKQVSRQHAKVLEDGHGRHILLDLYSRNGTYVEGKPIRRIVLQPNITITIADTTIAYEPFDSSLAPAPSPPLINIRSLSGTIQLSHLEAPTKDHPSAEYPSVEAWDQAEYAGPLLNDVVEYRMLRSQRLRGGLSGPRAERFATLRTNLRRPSISRSAVRRFRRFGCWVPVQMHLANGDQFPGHLRTLGADGARLVVHAPALIPETIVWLAVELLDNDQPREVVMSARIGWVERTMVGVTLTGTPRYGPGQYTEHGTREDARVSDAPRVARVPLPSLRLLP